MTLGYISDTLDIWGELSKTDAALPGEEEIRRTLKSFEGRQTQRPPIYSAIKYQGRKLYEYARAGKELPEDAIKVREIYISEVIVNQVDIDAAVVDFTVRCSRGTYIRSLCDDAGRLLGCGAVMSALTRLRSGIFSIEDSCTEDELREMVNTGEPPLLPMDYCLGHMPQLLLTDKQSGRFANGIKLELPSGEDAASNENTGFVRVYREQENAAFPSETPVQGDFTQYAASPAAPRGTFIGIGRYNGRELTPHKVIIEE